MQTGMQLWVMHTADMLPCDRRPLFEGVHAAPPAQAAAMLLAAAAVLLTLLSFLASVARFLRREFVMSGIPVAPGGNALLGHVLPMTMCVRQHKGAWDVIVDWVDKCPGPLIRFRILGTHCVAFKDPAGMKRVFQNAYKIYEKDLALSYSPFLPILGTGLVTADGDLWQKQRTLMGPALRIDVLDDIIHIAKKAVDRLTAKLEPYRGKGVAVDVNEEFRLLTLQVIGEAVLSMGPEECDEVRERKSTGAGTSHYCLKHRPHACMHACACSVVPWITALLVQAHSSRQSNVNAHEVSISIIYVCLWMHACVYTAFADALHTHHHTRLGMPFRGYAHVFASSYAAYDVRPGSHSPYNL